MSPAATPPPPGPTWDHVRAQIPATGHASYFNSGWSGPLLTPVVEAMEGCLRREWQFGPTTTAVVEQSLDLRAALRESIARAVQADADEILLAKNTTDGLIIVINGLDWEAGDVVVTTNAEHSSGLVPVYYLGTRHGVEARFVETRVDAPMVETRERFRAALTPEAKLVVLSHISYSTGQVFPLAEIVEVAHAVGARVLVDGAQTVGQIPLDLHGCGVDYYAFPAHKWLLGPDGIGALYIRRDLIADLEPWAAAGRAAKSLDFGGAGFEPEREDIMKFQLTSSSVPLAAGMAAAVDFYLQAGPEAVWARIGALAEQAGRALAALPGVRLLSPSRDETRSGLVTFAIEGWEGKPFADALQADHGVVCRSVAELNGVRWSLHYFNTEDEVERAVAAVGQIAGAG